MSRSALPLHERSCVEGAKALNAAKISAYLKQTPGWSVENGELRRSFKLADYYQTIGLVMRIALLAQRQNHHPDMEVGYNRLVVRFSTHSAGGLTENDFICAAGVNHLTE